MVAAVLLLLLGGVYAGLRLSPLSAVENVTVVGVEGPQARDARKAIEQAAIGQSTLAFDVGALRDAVREMSSITGVDAHVRFPHGVQIEVHQRVAVGALSVDGRKIAVATDGTLLPEWDAGTLPIINGGRATGGRLVTEHRDAALLLAAAPAPLAREVARVDRTTIVRLANGPALLFHDGTRLDAKWQSAAAVLADSSSVGATWIDLRVPERPVGGRGAPPVVPGADERARDLRADGAAADAVTGAGATPGTDVGPTGDGRLPGTEATDSAAGGAAGAAAGTETTEPAAQGQP